jgi:hypothetical protein
MTMKIATVAGSVALLLAGIVWAQETPGPSTHEQSPAALQAEIEHLKAPRVAWRQIAWKTCLLEALKESRDKKKPVLLWAFIDRPVDDARC